MLDLNSVSAFTPRIKTWHPSANRPEFRRDLIEGNLIQRPSYQEMVEVYHFLRGTGLSTVLCQTPFGHISPHVPDERR